MDPRVDSLPTRRRWLLLRRYKCMSDELMDVDAATSPPVTVRNLAVPRLRKCPFDIDTIDWRRARKLGAGIDGCVYRVYFGDQGPFALKLFWIPDKFVDSTAYSAVHRECQNAALLQMLRAAVDKTTLTSSAGADESIGPPLVHPNPMDFFTASDNLFAFSDEIRRRRREQKQKQTQPPPSEQEEVPVVTMPRFVKCYGWLPCNVHDLMEKMPRHIRLRGFRVDRKLYRSFDPERTDFIGIVYEYIRSNDADGGNVVIAGGNNIKATTTGDGTAKAEEMAATGKERPQAAAPSPSEKAATTTTARHYNTRAAARQMSNEAEAREKKHKEAHKAAASTKDKDAQDAAKDAVHREHVSSVADFLWLAGFDFCIQPLARNWKNGVLVDHSDIIGPYSSGWQRGPRDTKWSIDRLLTPSVIY